MSLDGRSHAFLSGKRPGMESPAKGVRVFRLRRLGRPVPPHGRPRRPRGPSESARRPPPSAELGAGADCGFGVRVPADSWGRASFVFRQPLACLLVKCLVWSLAILKQHCLPFPSKCVAVLYILDLSPVVGVRYFIPVRVFHFRSQKLLVVMKSRLSIIFKVLLFVSSLRNLFLTQGHV